MRRIERAEYLDWLARHRDEQIIKVVTGVRRCGKSTLFEIYRDYLIEHGVSPSRIIMLNFEDVEYEHLLEYTALYDHVKRRLAADQMNYVFLDEVQHVSQFEKVVDSLFLRQNCDVYITGSNAYFMSGELATRLSGRYIELKMLPLSFREFCSGLAAARAATNAERFNLYVALGSFPYVLKYNYEQREAREYLRDVYNTVLLKDVVARLNITDVNMLEAVAKFLLYSVGNRISPTKIARTLTSEGKKIDPKTVDRYIRGLTDSLMLYEARRYDIKGRQFLTQQSKFYAADVGMRGMLVRSSESDIGHVLENIVYLELLRRGYEVYVGQENGGEVDFVAIDGGKHSYYQIAATTLDEATLRRELAPLRRIADSYPKYLLTLDEVFGSMDYDGIQKINALEWLLR